MATEIRVSRQGLTCCPQCKSHIKMGPTPEETSCPFCQGQLVAAAPAKPALGNRGKALLAATLVGATISIASVACGPPASLYGGPPTENAQEQTSPDSGQPDTSPAPAYGVVPTPDGPVYGEPPTPSE